MVLYFFITLIYGKLRTPKNIKFNDLINFINIKYSTNISESLLDSSHFSKNSWFTGFTEADGHFGIKYIESKAKSDTRKRSVSENVSLKFRLDQRSFDKSTSSSVRPSPPRGGGGSTPRRGLDLLWKNWLYFYLVILKVIPIIWA